MSTSKAVCSGDGSLGDLAERAGGRTHQCLVELASGAGLPGFALAGLWFVLIGWLSWRARHSSQRWVAWAGSSFLLAIALQSITDYTLRNQTILAFAGLPPFSPRRSATHQRRALPVSDRCCGPRVLLRRPGS